MEIPLAEARAAAAAGEVPIGAAVFTENGELLAAAGNRKESSQDPTAHAETLAIRAAAKRVGGWRLEETLLFSTVEPCPLCLVRSALSALPWRGDSGADSADHFRLPRREVWRARIGRRSPRRRVESSLFCRGRGAGGGGAGAFERVLPGAAGMRRGVKIQRIVREKKPRFSFSFSRGSQIPSSSAFSFIAASVSSINFASSIPSSGSHC